MNFLAHSYFSPPDGLIQMGNTFGDFVKGRKMEGITEGVKQGVFLHRSIDAFTDNHKGFKGIATILRPTLGRYAGIVVDLCLDYHLASNWENYAAVSLVEYEEGFYKSFQKVKSSLSPAMQDVGEIMYQRHWMLKYASLEGLEEILSQMNSRMQRRSAGKLHHELSLTAGMTVIETELEEINRLSSQLFLDAQSMFVHYA